MLQHKSKDVGVNMEDEELVKMFNLTLDLWESLQLSQSFVNTLAHFVLKSWFVSTSLSILHHAGVEFCFILDFCIFVCKWFLILFSKKKKKKRFLILIFGSNGYWFVGIIVFGEWLRSYWQSKRIYGVDLRFYTNKRINKYTHSSSIPYKRILMHKWWT